MGLDLLFDLDGTLTDPEPGITACFQYALTKLGWERLLQRGALRRYIGPPLRQSFAEILETNDDTLIESAVATYRERFAETGIYLDNKSNCTVNEDQPSRFALFETCIEEAPTSSQISSERSK